MVGNRNLTGGDIDKIDSQSTEGLEGTDNSLAYRVHEIEKHFHNIERWFGSDGDGTGSTANNLTEWQLTAGVGGAFGTEAQILGANDITISDFGFTPVKFDPHFLLITQSNTNDVNYIIQFYCGETDFASSDLCTEIPYRTGANSAEVVPIPMLFPRIPVAEKMWARVKCETDSATLQFLLGIHAYIG